MEKLKFYFSDETTLTIPENIAVKYTINSAITNMVYNISISIFHKLDNLTLLLKDIFVSSIKDKVVVKVERYNNTTLIDTLTGDSLSVSWNLGNDFIAGEEVYNEVINIGER